MITSKTNKKIRVGIRAAVQKSNLDRGGENMKKKENKSNIFFWIAGAAFLLCLVMFLKKKNYIVIKPRKTE